MPKMPSKHSGKITKVTGPQASFNAEKESAAQPKKQCGLCGKKTKLMRTDCCGQWICNDEDNYVLFSYGRNSCARNHRRYTLCGHHSGEEHDGRWQDCAKCRKDIEPEMYAYYGTNDYNFEKLAEVPAFMPTHCIKCKRVIRLAEDGYSLSSEGHTCDRCFKFPT